MSNARNLSKLLGTDTQITTPDIADGVFQANKNLIINGAMQVAQRGTSSTSTTGYNSVDRIMFNNVNTNTTVTHSQQQDGPNGLEYCFEAKNTTDGTPASNAYIELQTRLEANDARILNQSDEFTLSFYYKSNITATLPVQIYHRTDANSVWSIWKGVSVIGDGEWHRAELTFTKNTAVAADPKTGTDWGFVAAMNFELGTTYVNTSNENVWQNNGSVIGPNFGLCGSLNNYIRITGMQVEVGSTATPFEHRSYGDELARCQRYYETDMPEGGSDTRYSMNMNTTSSHYFQESFQVTKRAIPAITVNQTYNDNLTVAGSTGTTSRHHAGFAASNGGTTTARALAEFNWTADAEL